MKNIKVEELFQNNNTIQFWWNSLLMPKTNETQANAHPLGSIVTLSSIARCLL